MFMMHFVSNCDHAHLSESMKNDVMSCAWDYNYALGADTRNAQEQLQETMQHLQALPRALLRPAIDSIYAPLYNLWASTRRANVSVTCSFGLGLIIATYMGTYITH